MSKKFPKVVYVTHDKQDDGVEYMLVDENPINFSEKDKSVTVGVYQLVKVANVKNTSVLDLSSGKK